MDQKLPHISQYSDYRLYLNDYYQAKREATKSARRPYSYSTFSAAADIKSPHYLKLIIEGERNLSDAMIRKFTKALDLNKDDAEEFALLVHYNQAQDPMERNRHIKTLSEFRIARQLKSGAIDAATWDKVPSWVTWALYALADQKGTSANLNDLYQLLGRKVRSEEIRRGLERLLRGGELSLNPETQRLTKERELMTGSESIPVELVRKLQAELIYLGLESLFHDAPTEREFGAMTVAMTEPEFEQLRFEVRQLRKKWIKDFSVRRKNEKGDRVYQLNIQLFPMTKKSSEASLEATASLETVEATPSIPIIPSSLAATTKASQTAQERSYEVPQGGSVTATEDTQPIEFTDELSDDFRWKELTP